jgi:hypothetical protein
MPSDAEDITRSYVAGPLSSGRSIGMLLLANYLGVLGEIRPEQKRYRRSPERFRVGPRLGVGPSKP